MLQGKWTQPVSEYPLWILLLVSFPLCFKFMAHPLSFLAIGSSEGATQAATLAPGVDYLEWDGILNILGLCLHRLLCIIICEGCRVALTHSLVLGHLKLHHTALSESQATELNAICSTWNIYQAPQDVSLPRPGGPPIQGISQPTTGFTCIADPRNCFYCVRDRDRMQKHAREKHGDVCFVDMKY